jgi:hypothetical protein
VFDVIKEAIKLLLIGGGHNLLPLLNRVKILLLFYYFASVASKLKPIKRKCLGDDGQKIKIMSLDCRHRMEREKDENSRCDENEGGKVSVRK